jgi:hypothetical protein
MARLIALLQVHSLQPCPGDVSTGRRPTHALADRAAACMRTCQTVTDARSAMLPVTFLQMPAAARALHPLLSDPIETLACGTVGAACPDIVVAIPAPVARSPDETGSLDDRLNAAWRRRRLIVDGAACDRRTIGTRLRTELTPCTRRPVARLEAPAVMRGRQPAPRNPSEPWTLRDVRAADPCVTTAAGVPSPETRSPHVAGSHHNLFDSRRRRSRLDNDFLRGGGVVGIRCRSGRSVAIVGSLLFVLLGASVFSIAGIRCRYGALRWCRRCTGIGCGLRVGSRIRCRWRSGVAAAEGDSNTEQSYQGYIAYRHDAALHCGFDCQMAAASLHVAI